MPEENKIYTARFGDIDTYLEHVHAKDVTVKEGGLKGRFQEEELLNDLRDMEIEGVYIDGGANIGNHSLFFLTHCVNMNALVSVEAHPEIAAVLVRNYHRNAGAQDFDHIHFVLVNAALERHGKKTCHLSPIVPGNAGRTHVVRDGGNKDIEVPCITLDQIWSDLQSGVSGFGPTVGLLKLDIEDSECQAMRGATQLLCDNRPVIVAEHHTRKQFDEFESLVRPFGYRVEPKTYDPRGETRIWLHSS